MDTAARLLNDLTSWYWWLSVVVVGLAINLSSAYLKSPLDNWLSKKSTHRQARRSAQADRFDSEVARIAANPTLLILEGQNATQSELKVLLMSILVGVNLVLLFILSGQPEPRSWLMRVLPAFVALSMPFLIGNWLSAMRSESRVENRYSSALAKYKKEAHAGGGSKVE
jgi:hypothetical protein